MGDGSAGVQVMESEEFIILCDYLGVSSMLTVQDLAEFAKIAVWSHGEALYSQ